jgi:hypothetical protein
LFHGGSIRLSSGQRRSLTTLLCSSAKAVCRSPSPITSSPIFRE